MIEILEQTSLPGSPEDAGDTVMNSDRGGFFLVNRLDRLTSGIVLVARTAEKCAVVAKQFADRLVKKSYICRCVGEFPEGEMVCEEPISTFSFKPSVSYISKDGKPSKTKFKRLHYNGRTSLVACFPETGRTHQVTHSGYNARFACISSI